MTSELPSYESLPETRDAPERLFRITCVEYAKLREACAASGDFIAWRTRMQDTEKTILCLSMAIGIETLQEERA